MTWATISGACSRSAFSTAMASADGRSTPSFGLSHRAVGATVMVHGDDAGLKLPPAVAPVQVIVIPIWRTDGDLAMVEEAVKRLTKRITPVARVRVDWRDDRTPGYKFNEWELKGAPIRLEVGPRDVAAGQAILVRRDTREKRPVPIDALAPVVEGLLGEIQAELFTAARSMARRAHRRGGELRGTGSAGRR